MATKTATTIDWKSFQKEMEGMFGPSATSGASADKTAPAGYDLTGLQTQIGDTQKKLETAQSGLKNYYTTRYDQEYSARGLGDIKNKIADLDAKIASEKGVRDESISKTRRNPYYSAATITGESSEIERLANANINNLVDQRNSMSGQYNTTLDEITKKVAAETGEKEREVDELKYTLSNLQKSYSDYRDELRKELEQQESTKRWEAEFMLQLQDAQQRADEAAAKSSGGGSSGTAAERMASRVAQGLEPDPTLRATAQRLISQGITDPTRLGYTGELAVQLESEIDYLNKQSPQKETSSAPSASKGTTSEGTFRREIRNAWKEGYSAEELKQAYGGISFSDSKKTAAEVIDDEWKIKTAPGVGGFLGRLFRIGV